ncbi:MAG TPA: DUF4058 family protein [Abditibacteriaceae bacterium]|jgi:hypothetical protein
MPNPFPGMNPYLEDTSTWRTVHTMLLTYVHDTLQPQLVPRYVARIDEEIEIEDNPRRWRPDVLISAGTSGNGNGTPGISASGGVATLAKPLVLPRGDEPKHRWIEIIDVKGREVITVIEVLSPSNKSTSGYGSETYKLKMQDLWSRKINVVEIDLLRAGLRITLPEVDLPPRRVPAHDYIVSVSRGFDHDQYEVYPFSMHEAAPPVAIPLRRGEDDVLLELTPLIERVYDNGAFEMDVDYRQTPPLPPLSEENAAWLDALLKEKGLRH